MTLRIRQPALPATPSAPVLSAPTVFNISDASAIPRVTITF